MKNRLHALTNPENPIQNENPGPKKPEPIQKSPQQKLPKNFHPGSLDGHALGSQVSKPFLQAASTLAAAALREKAAVGMEEVATTWKMRPDIRHHGKFRTFGIWLGLWEKNRDGWGFFERTWWYVWRCLFGVSWVLNTSYWISSRLKEWDCKYWV